MERTIKLLIGFCHLAVIHYPTESKNRVVKRVRCHMSDCPQRWVGTMYMSLPVADLGPPQTGHGLFQVLP